VDEKKIEALVANLLVELGEDPEREGLLKTPQRVAKSYQKLFEGYSRSLEKEITTFENIYNYDELIYSGEIVFFSTCEHHLLPFFGTAHIAYIPNKKIIGLSKLARAVDIYSRRLQDQERITMQITAELDKLLEPKGVAVWLEARHFCNMSRGVQQDTSIMKTMAFRGVLKSDLSTRDHFMALVASK
jgi:GTP cyclohydrolase I